MASDMGHTSDPSFEEPPVTEVVLAVQFVPISQFSLFVGDVYREIFLPAGYNNWEERSPFVPSPERFGQQARLPEIRFEVLELPPARRFWFTTPGGTELVQVQSDWFAQNWRSTPDAPHYPRYWALRGPFGEHLSRLNDFVQAWTGEPIVPVQCEVTYVNRLSQSGVWEGLGEADKVTALWSRASEFLPIPERVQFNTSYLIPDETTGEPCGRLHVAFGPGQNDDTGAPEFSLTLTARSEPKSRDMNGVMQCLDLAHHWVVNGFRSIATPEMRAVWKEDR